MFELSSRRELPSCHVSTGAGRVTLKIEAPRDERLAGHRNVEVEDGRRGEQQDAGD